MIMPTRMAQEVESAAINSSGFGIGYGAIFRLDLRGEYNN
jgi:hypothetical protein